MITQFKIYENYLKNVYTLSDAKYFDVPEEVFKLREILKELVKKDLLYYANPENNINLERHDKKEYDSFSISLDIYKNYFIFQVDYKVDEIWIKYLNGCEGELERDISKFKIFFDAISKENNQGVWIFDKDSLLKGLDNFDFYIQTDKYNL